MTRRPGRECGGKRGDTLTEPAVILAVAGLLLAIGLPSFAGYQRAATIRNAYRQLVTDLRYARQKALAEHHQFVAVFQAGPISIRTGAPDDLVIDAHVMAAGESGVFTVEDYYLGDYRGEVHLRGGVVQHNCGAFDTFNGGSLTGYGRDFRYDSRGKVPPFYPTTSRFAVDEPAPAIIAWREE